ncbi:MAG: hypothetical protein WA040_24940, partial [Anaerolineae bacterium]
WEREPKRGGAPPLPVGEGTASAAARPLSPWEREPKRDGAPPLPLGEGTEARRRAPSPLGRGLG